jgi:hypothetical protein
MAVVQTRNVYKISPAKILETGHMEGKDIIIIKKN